MAGQEQELTLAEKEELAKILSSAPMPDEKHTVFTFLDNVAKSKDTTKTGFLKDEEIGMLENPTRTYKEIGLFAQEIMHNKALGDYMNASSEIVTSTSLSRNAMRLDLQSQHRNRLQMLPNLVNQAREFLVIYSGAVRRKKMEEIHYNERII